MLPVLSGNRTDTDLSKMKFLVLAACVCMAVAAPQSYKPLRKAAAVAASPYVKTAKVASKAAPVAAQAIPVAAQAAAEVAYPAAKVVSQAASGNDYDAAIVRSESDVRADGFNYNVETGNGISAEASGSLKKVDDAEVLVFQGSYRYTDTEGNPVVFTYIADENGYQPQSDSIPTPPPVPEAILRSLEYIAAHPQQVEK